jgi:hypothetical protein
MKIIMIRLAVKYIKTKHMKNDFKVSDVLFLDYFLCQSRLISCSTPEVAPIINVRAVVLSV